MRNVRINEAESIFEVYWDCGDSYADHQKYNCLENYSIECDNGAKISVFWCGISVNLSGTDDKKPVRAVMKRSCSLDISEFDIFRLYASISKEISFNINCVIDGEKKKVISDCGCEIGRNFDGKISGSLITEIELEFTYCGNNSTGAVLSWLGLSNSEKQREMEKRPSPYDDKWEGCFCDNPEIKPLTGMYFDECELEAIREKVKSGPYLAKMNKLREKALADMKIEPEKEIGTFVADFSSRWCMPRDRERTVLYSRMSCLAFVGIVDGNPEMLRLACRMALSLAHHTYWCESIIGVFPGAVWHHRSFLEEVICISCCKVLEWAGSFLTWHGRNIIYDAIIMKGLPRLMSDIKTMEYMWSMNQGIVFDSSLISILIFLQKRYPRYESDIDFAEKALYEMIGNYYNRDGGVAEGAGYWNYATFNVIRAIRMLARYRGKSVLECTPDFLKNNRFAVTMISDDDSGCFCLPVNDTSIGLGYSNEVLSFFAELGVDRRWEYLYSKASQNPDSSVTAEEIIYGGDVKNIEEYELDEEFVNLEHAGVASLRRRDKKLGNIRLFIQNSAIQFSHTHADKGSFIIEAGSKPILIDRGVCDYGNAQSSLMSFAVYHNLLVPEIDGTACTQNKTDHEKSGKLTEASFDGEVFRYSVDLTEIWDGVFKKYIRSFYSDSPAAFVITDDVQCDTGTELSFRLNTYGVISEFDGAFVIDCGDVKLRVEPLNWKPERFTAGEFGFDGDLKPVNQLALFTGPVKNKTLETRLTVF